MSRKVLTLLVALMIAALALSACGSKPDSSTSNSAAGARADSATSARTDTDGDGIPNNAETVLGSDPNNADTDRDGQNDLTDQTPM